MSNATVQSLIDHTLVNMYDLLTPEEIENIDSKTYRELVDLSLVEMFEDDEDLEVI
jgi:hypothetical protein